MLLEDSFFPKYKRCTTESPSVFSNVSIQQTHEAVRHENVFWQQCPSSVCTSKIYVYQPPIGPENPNSRIVIKSSACSKLVTFHIFNYSASGEGRASNLSHQTQHRACKKIVWYSTTITIKSISISSQNNDVCPQYLHCTDEDQQSETARLSTVHHRTCGSTHIL